MKFVDDDDDDDAHTASCLSCTAETSYCVMCPVIRQMLTQVCKMFIVPEPVMSVAIRAAAAVGGNVVVVVVVDRAVVVAWSICCRELLEMSHIRSIYHIFVAILIVFMLNTFVSDVMEHGRSVICVSVMEHGRSVICVSVVCTAGLQSVCLSVVCTAGLRSVCLSCARQVCDLCVCRVHGRSV